LTCKILVAKSLKVKILKTKELAMAWRFIHASCAVLMVG